jgi:restriction system protein
MSAFSSIARFFRPPAVQTLDEGQGLLRWRDFDVLLNEHFRRQGYLALERSGGAPDGSSDLLLQRGTSLYLAMCGPWRAEQVDATVVRGLHDALVARRMAGGFVVTSGVFTDDASRFAEGKALHLIDGRTLLMSLRGQMSLTPPQVRETVAFAGTKPLPVCPKCGAPMGLRELRLGPDAGQRFWGCSRRAETGCTGILKPR